MALTKDVVKPFITNHKEDMNKNGLVQIWVRGGMASPEVYFVLKSKDILKDDLVYQFWSEIIAPLRRMGAWPGMGDVESFQKFATQPNWQPLVL